MLTIRPTKMLARRLGLEVPVVPPGVANRVADWCAHECQSGRFRYLIFCNTAALFPAVTYARGVVDGHSLIERLVDALKLNWWAETWSFNSSGGSSPNWGRCNGGRSRTARC